MQGADTFHLLSALFHWFWRCPKTEITSHLSKHCIWLHQFHKESFNLSLSYFTPFPVALYVPHLADTAQIFPDVALRYYFHKDKMLFVIAPRGSKNETFHFTAVFMMHNPRRALPHELSKVLLGQCMLVMPLLYTNTGFAPVLSSWRKMECHEVKWWVRCLSAFCSRAHHIIN